MDNNKPGMPGMGLQMPGSEAPQDMESRIADLEARIQALEDAGGASGSPVPPILPTE